MRLKKIGTALAATCLACGLMASPAQASEQEQLSETFTGSTVADGALNMLLLPLSLLIAPILWLLLAAGLSSTSSDLINGQPIM